MNSNATPLLPRKIEHSQSLNFTIVAQPFGHYVDFDIYDIEGWIEGERKGAYDTPQWHKASSDQHPDPVMRIEEAQRFLHGSVNWVGCSNWYFDAQDRAMLHGCDRHDVQRFGAVMALCWDLAAQLCAASTLTDAKRPPLA